MYKYGIRNGTLQREWEEALKAAGEIGFDGVELTVNEPEEVDRLLTDAGRDEVLRWVKQYGCEASSLSIGAFGRYKREEGDPDARKAMVELTQKSVVACKAVGGVGILLPYFEREHIDITEEEEARLVEDMKQCAAAAEEHRIAVCLETSFSSGQLKRICDGIGSKWIGVYQDIGNALHFGHDSVEMLRSLPDETLMVHVKDTDRALLGQGKVDFPGCRKALRDIGYEGWLVFETAPGDDPIESASKNLEYAKQAFE